REAGDTGPPGDLVDTENRVLGRHAGLANYTVGQRRGLGVASARPLYVVALDPGGNRVIVGEDREQYRGGLFAERVNWVSIERPTTPIEATARIRSGHAGAEAVVTPLDGGRIQVTFDAPQRAVTPGQAVVLYRGDLLLGGGFIQAAV
ncbi:MAG TPA: aminomethyltransferase beta-barrel domain-containing protein, partial [Candidatus Binatia bacterium]|nr:aminomethyltransferase beta-barrel domain-containing protein [Candidatus Binatia bacterium]